MLLAWEEDSVCTSPPWGISVFLTFALEIAGVIDAEFPSSKQRSREHSVVRSYVSSGHVSSGHGKLEGPYIQLLGN